LDDIKNIQNDQLNFRLCKGIYKESEDISIQDRKHINENYLKILRYAFTAENYVGIATHDIDLLKEIYSLIDELNVSPSRFEFQILYGVPMSGWLEKHLENKFKVRIYVPFGPDWYEYSIRRLKENPNIAAYVIKNLFR
ncbi:MAG: proline dehydrogenase, partial [Candidatus Marinimicrobia bacterium]|nr:proline dehydrogenase [Candidatus Neomarinimicrobiota bacterium]